MLSHYPSFSFINILQNEINKKHMLTHTFYKSWTKGFLTREDLRYYTMQYFHFVINEARFLSAIHANTPHIINEDGTVDLSDRQNILDNLIGEEQGIDNHPTLWLQFAQYLGLSSRDVTETKLLPSTSALVDTYKKISNTSPFYCGLAAMFAFESQIPQVAEKKIEGLAKYYNAQPEDYKFFTVHQTADIHHSKIEAQIIAKHVTTPENKQKTLKSATAARDALWNFLSGIVDNYAPHLWEKCASDQNNLKI